MNYTIQLTDQAKIDLRGIYEYIAFTLLEPETAKEKNRCGGKTAVAKLNGQLYPLR